jgi:hypothetical protein
LRHGLAALAIAAAATSFAGAPASAATLDRTVARFLDPEAASESAARRFVGMRELVVESWLATLERTTGSPPSSLDDRTVRGAFERHVIEALLGERMLPPAVEARVAELAEQARRVEIVEVGGQARFERGIELATGAKDGGVAELTAIFRRRARAELYLEVAVSQPVRPSDAELRAAFSKAPDEIAKLGFEASLPLLRAYVRSARLRELAQSYYQAVRGRLHLEIMNP